MSVLVTIAGIARDQEITPLQFALWVWIFRVDVFYV
jgi:hypothetical protein